MAKKLVVNALEEIGDLFPRKRARIKVIKQTPRNVEKAYTPTKPLVKTNIEVSDKTRDIMRQFHKYLDDVENQYGTRPSAANESIMKRVIKQYPESFNRSPGIAAKKYTSNNFNISDYFPSYRGIGNIDSTFENAYDAYESGAPMLAKQFVSAGLKDVAAIAKGISPTSFKYKPHTGIVPQSVIQEIVTRNNAPAGTLEWLQNINVKNPNLGTNYLDMFARQPEYFKPMFDINGNMIK